MTGLRIAFLGIATVALSACQIEGGGGEAAMPGASDGARLYQEYCTICHGVDGKGDGPMARAMRKPPRDLTLLSVRNGDVYPAARVLSTIDGYARSDIAGPGMPEFGELLRGDLVPYDTGDGILTPTPRTLVALTEYLRTIQATR
ncbi:Cytochrome C oxidase, cbb3-type, subunit III [Roseivivax lentus]|uniref:Cytochrome C oxidase, cbb3-type, subunit III n=1 Tax=Roseivivax lentus TaxID=633194 RepID=A0A1N7PJE9_9RHOB|nr:cytochrome c [Roseivivax lentus]SIT10755.1 Cytochrome C oxidase, cbb3-type, subunit III [Roseivivax lentus]